jgi:hypothetical protein
MAPSGVDAEFAAFGCCEQVLVVARGAIDQDDPGALPMSAERWLVGANRLFPSQDDHDLAVARAANQELRAEIRARLDVGHSSLNLIRAPIAAQVMWAEHHQNLYRFLVGSGYQRSSRWRPAQRRDFAAELAEAGARYIPRFADDPDFACVTLIAVIELVDAWVLRWLSQPTETREQLINQLAAKAFLIIAHRLRQIGVEVDCGVPLPRAPARR